MRKVCKIIIVHGALGNIKHHLRVSTFRRAFPAKIKPTGVRGGARRVDFIALCSCAIARCRRRRRGPRGLAATRRVREMKSPKRSNGSTDLAKSDGAMYRARPRRVNGARTSADHAEAHPKGASTSSGDHGDADAQSVHCPRRRGGSSDVANAISRQHGIMLSTGPPATIGEAVQTMWHRARSRIGPAAQRRRAGSRMCRTRSRTRRPSPRACTRAPSPHSALRILCTHVARTNRVPAYAVPTKVVPRLAMDWGVLSR